MNLFTVILVGIIIILLIIILTVYSPGVTEFTKRILDGQWFEIGAERRGDVLEIDVTARHHKEDHKASPADAHADPSGFEKGTTNIPEHNPPRRSGGDPRGIPCARRSVFI